MIGWRCLPLEDPHDPDEVEAKVEALAEAISRSSPCRICDLRMVNGRLWAMVVVSGHPERPLA